MLFAAAFLGYMLALFQRRVRFMGSPKINNVRELGESNSNYVEVDLLL